MQKYNVGVAVVVRPAGKDGRVLSHDKITEVYYVLGIRHAGDRRARRRHAPGRRASVQA